jgi:hypothetical protein
LLFAIIFLNVLLTLELLHFVLKVEWDYQYRKFEENVVCWHHHVCHISESLHNLYVYALRHVRQYLSGQYHGQYWVRSNNQTKTKNTTLSQQFQFKIPKETSRESQNRYH